MRTCSVCGGVGGGDTSSDGRCCRCYRRLAIRNTNFGIHRTCKLILVLAYLLTFLIFNVCMHVCGGYVCMCVVAEE